MPDARVVVVGAGMGGLTSALLLAARGLDVTVVERAAAPGGKIRQVQVGGVGIDAGPTVFTMRWILEEIFERAGASLSDELALEPLQVLARHAWGADPSRDRLDLFADLQQSADAIARFSSPDEGRRFLAFCDEARRVYQTLEGPYIRSAKPSVAGMIGRLGVRGLATLTALGPFATLEQRLAKCFTDPRLRQLFGRYATYCGASPALAPATLMLVAQVELDGVWAVRGGMHAVARSVAALAEKRGARFHYGQGVQRIELSGGAVCAVHLEDGTRLPADAVVFNGDSAALADGLLGDGVRRAVPGLPSTDRSLSALTWAMKVPAAGFPLVRHNVFFDNDYRSEFDDIFRRRRLPQKGTVYVCAQDRHDDGGLDSGPERLLCLVNAPPHGDQPEDLAEIDACQTRAFALLKRCGLLLEAGPMERTSPQGFHQLFPATGGALYGRASHGWMALFKRPSAASRVPGLYLAGGSVHPGPGVPMAAMSGRRAAETLMAHLDSTPRLHPVPTSGGTSTPSATTAATR